MITSRRRLSGLVATDGAIRITLLVLDPSESMDLLRTLLLGDRSGPRDAEAVRRLAEPGGPLPLALRIAAQRLLDGEPALVVDLVRELTLQSRRLDTLRIADDPLAEVRVVFAASYRRLETAEARAFRLFGLYPTAQANTA